MQHLLAWLHAYWRPLLEVISHIIASTGQVVAGQGCRGSVVMQLRELTLKRIRIAGHWRHAGWLLIGHYIFGTWFLGNIAHRYTVQEAMAEFTTQVSAAAPFGVRITYHLAAIVSLDIVHEQFQCLALVSFN